jgi:hypothetical protein
MVSASNHRTELTSQSAEFLTPTPLSHRCAAYLPSQLSKSVRDTIPIIWQAVLFNGFYPSLWSRRARANLGERLRIETYLLAGNLKTS